MDICSCYLARFFLGSIRCPRPWLLAAAVLVLIRANNSRHETRNDKNRTSNFKQIHDIGFLADESNICTDLLTVPRVNSQRARESVAALNEMKQNII